MLRHVEGRVRYRSYKGGKVYASIPAAPGHRPCGPTQPDGASMASALDVGQKAPDFTLNSIDGKPVKLSDLTAKGPVVIYTFIAAFTNT